MCIMKQFPCGQALLLRYRVEAIALMRSFQWVRAQLRAKWIEDRLGEETHEELLLLPHKSNRLRKWGRLRGIKKFRKPSWQIRKFTLENITKNKVKCNISQSIIPLCNWKPSWFNSITIYWMINPHTSNAKTETASTTLPFSKRKLTTLSEIKSSSTLSDKRS